MVSSVKIKDGFFYCNLVCVCCMFVYGKLIFFIKEEGFLELWFLVVVF